jgi:hypothetical protein
VATNEIVKILSVCEPIGCLVVLYFILKQGCLRVYPFLLALLGVRALSFCIEEPLTIRGFLHMSVAQAYFLYFYIYWISYAIETLLGLAIIVQVFKMALEPLEGLRDLGMVIFRWVAAISVVISVSISFGPHVSGQDFILHVISQLQRSQSILTLCLLLFVCLTLRPLGLSVRSRVFGVALGLGVFAMTDLVQAAWIPKTSNVYSMYSLINLAAIVVALGIWAVYFAIAEPERRIILLPTTSPFFRWNQISEALGDEPGYVALGQFTPDMFAPAEIEMMRRAEQMQKAVGM